MRYRLRVKSVTNKCMYVHYIYTKYILLYFYWTERKNLT